MAIVKVPYSHFFSCLIEKGKLCKFTKLISNQFQFPPFCKNNCCDAVKQLTFCLKGDVRTKWNF